MRGPIDYIIVGFEGNKFDGSIVKALEDATKQGVISVIALALVSKDDGGIVTTVDAVNLGDDYLVEFTESIKTDKSVVTQEDIEEVAAYNVANGNFGILFHCCDY